MMLSQLLSDSIGKVLRSYGGRAMMLDHFAWPTKCEQLICHMFSHSSLNAR